MTGSDYHRIEKAIRFLEANAEAQPSLADLAALLGLSESHCHRLFRRWAGLTPKDFLQVITLARAKALLAGSRSVMESSLALGLTGASRLHDLFIHHEAMTPGEYKRGGEGLEISWGQFESPLGDIAIGWTSRGICSLSFFEKPSEALDHLHRCWPKARISPDERGTRPFAREIVSRMKGERAGQMSLLPRGTPFQVKVWEALLRIPEGQVTTYQEIANLIGAPKSARAVGTAVGANPIGYLIPCHRVIRSTGVIGDYHWGAARKTALLAAEIGRRASER